VHPSAVVAFSFVSGYWAHVAIPLALARRGPRIGWVESRPQSVNRLGLLSVGLGAIGLAWCYLTHYAPGETVPVSLVPEHLLTAGPYRFSRNPIYLSEQAMWLGWSWFFGSPVVGSCALGFAAFMRGAVHREERTLEMRFGDRWCEYAARVPRWL
jgi:protein-S-isoprenylcysteine O-methyltransferase Ste14